MAEQIEEVPAELIQTRVYELHPNTTMRRVLDEACDYRRYCWNQGLALWNEMYKARQALKSSLASDSKRLTEEPLSDEFGVASYFKEKGRYYVAIPYKIKSEDVKLPDKTGKKTSPKWRSCLRKRELLEDESQASSMLSQGKQYPK